MGIGDFHAVDFDKDEVVEFFGLYACVQLADYLPDCGGFPSTRHPGYVYASACAGSDGGFEMGIDCGELGGAAGKSERDGRHVQIGASELEWGRCMRWGQDSGMKGGEG